MLENVIKLAFTEHVLKTTKNNNKRTILYLIVLSQALIFWNSQLRKRLFLKYQHRSNRL